MQTVALLFDREYTFLGELATRQGSLVRVMLTAEGEARLGSHVADWQTRGVPVLRTVVAAPAEHSADVYFQERVQVRDAGFLSAMTHWIERHNMALLSLEPDTMECWERIARLPVDPSERFSILVTVRSATKGEMQTWKEVLLDAMRMVEVEEGKMNAAIEKLRQQTVKSLVTTFSKKSEKMAA